MLARRVTTILATLALALGLAVAIPVATNTAPEAAAATPGAGYCGGDTYRWPYWYDFLGSYQTSYIESWSGARVVITWHRYRISDGFQAWYRTNRCRTQYYG